MTDISSEAVERAWEEFEISSRPISNEGDMDIYDVNGLTDAGYELKVIVDAQAERIKELEGENGILRTEKHADAEAIASARNDALRGAAARCGDGEVSRMYRDAILALIEGNAHG